jgi:hypothetical protein
MLLCLGQSGPAQLLEDDRQLQVGSCMHNQQHRVRVAMILHTCWMRV